MYKKKEMKLTDHSKTDKGFEIETYR